ncbi:MAG TPA: hypothetical protein VMT08_24820 [Bradyrhizobium sp.]|nr:hypothetical protein [Bradyrhizobium sp.]
MNDETKTAIRRQYALTDWTFVFGLPTTQRQFENAKAYGEFCILPPGYRSFSSYESVVLGRFSSLIEPLERLGLRIVRYPTSKAYMRVLAGRAPSILYTHCSQNSRLEFSDGLVSFVDLARRLSPNFHGIAEICACAPIQLNALFKEKAPSATIATAFHELSVDLWISYYARFLVNFAEGQCSYWEATVRTREELAKLTGRDAIVVT